MNTAHQATERIVTLPTELTRREGWPWNAPLPEAGAPVDTSLPRITIVTPNYNYGSLIERTIRSVLAQNYPNLEFIIIDDGSTDDSVSVIRRFEKHLAFWRTGANRGQSAVINEGLQRATGDIFNWLNSDDYLMPGALFEVAKSWKAGHQVVCGVCEMVDLDDRVLGRLEPHPPQGVGSYLADKEGNVMPQPSVFLDRKLTVEAGGITEDLRYLMDWELYIRLALRGPNARYSRLPNVLSRVVYHPGMKTARLGGIIRAESKLVLKRSCDIAGESDRKLLDARLRRFEGEDRLSAIRQNKLNPMGQFLGVARECPELVGTRFFWGAVARHLPVRVVTRARREVDRVWFAYLNSRYRLPTLTRNEVASYRGEIDAPLGDDVCMNPFLGLKNDADDWGVLVSLLKSLEPKIVVELGTAYGNLTANLCRLVPGARVYTVNALPEEHTMSAFKLEESDIGRVYRKYGYADRVEQILEDTRKLDLGRYLASPVVDFAIVDACHEPDFVINDFLKVAPYVRSGGVVILHDTHPSMEGHLGDSYRACMELRRRGYDICHVDGSWWGYWKKS